MNKERLLTVLKQPAALQHDKDLPLLKELTDTFPYFSTSYVLLTRLMHEQKSIHFDKYLKLSAIYIGDREVLYNYLHPAKEQKIEEAAKEEAALALPPAGEVAAALPEQAVIALAEGKQTEPKIVAAATEETPVIPLPAYMPPAAEEEVETKEPEEMAKEEAQNTDTETATTEAEEEEEVSREQYGLDKLELTPVSAYDYFAVYKIESPEPKAGEEPEVRRNGSLEEAIQQGASLSFAAWLKLLDGKDKPAEKTESQPASKTEVPKKESLLPPVNKPGRKETDDIITRFIKQEAKTKTKPSKFFSPEVMAQKSVEIDNSLATETLANIYLKQGLDEKAIEIFEQLRLRYPQKSTYFADKIEEIKNKH